MSTLSELKPTEKRRVIDLVKAAGVDVTDWANVKGGSKRAAVNPKYCYDWALVQPGKVVVPNLWHGQMRPRRGTIVVDLDFRRYAQKRAQGNSRDVWRQRSARMDNAVRVAFTHGLPVRVVVIDGTRRSWNDPNAQASSVARRELDPERWSVSAYDSRTGHGQLTRGASPKWGNERTSYFSQIRSALQHLATDVSAGLHADRRTIGLPLISSERRRIKDGHTGGYWTALGSLTHDVSIEIWLDHFSGLPAPRLWVGFSSSSWRHLSSLLAVAPLDGMSEHLLRRTSGDMTEGSFYHFKNPLRSDEFDVLVREGYESYHYLGTYYPYSWPFSRSDRSALVREAANLLASVYTNLTRRPATPGNARVPGPWNRPDPRSENAAIRHVTKHLRAAGYSIRSREREICGYDLHATGGPEELHVEVKGCASSAPRFFISRTELRTAKADNRWRLAVVTNALRHPAPPHFLTHARMEQVFGLEPTQWEGRPRTR